MSILLPTAARCAVSRKGIDLIEGNYYVCKYNYFVCGPYGFKKGNIYKCTESYYIRCNGSPRISQWKLPEDLFGQATKEEIKQLRGEL